MGIVRTILTAWITLVLALILRRYRQQAPLQYLQLLSLGMNPPPYLQRQWLQRTPTRYAMHLRLRHVILAPSSSGLRSHSSGLPMEWLKGPMDRR